MDLRKLLGRAGARRGKSRLSSGSAIARKRLYCAEELECRRMLSLTVPQYSSLPSAPHTLYLDFLGMPAFTWNNTAVHGPGGAGTPVPAFSTDGDTSNFSSSELTAIQAIWAAVAEKFSPFNVNVTTVDPGSYGAGQAAECVIGGSTNDWYSSSPGGKDAGGVALIGAFASRYAVTRLLCLDG